MRSRLSLRRILGPVVLVLIFGYAAYRLATDWPSLSSLSLQPLLMAAHLLALVVAFALMALAWSFTLEALHFEMPLLRRVVTWLVPNAGKYVPGKVFMLSGRVELVHRSGGRRAQAAMGLFFEHAAMLLAATPLAVQGLLQGLHIPAHLARVVMGITVAACLLLACKPLWLVDAMNACLKRMKRPPLERSFNRRYFSAAFVCYLLVWLLYGVSGHLLLRALNLHDVVPLWPAIAISVAAWMIGFCSLLTPGGMGIREAVFAGFLADYLDPTQALAIALLFRVTWTLVEWGGVAVGLILLHMQERTKERAP